MSVEERGSQTVAERHSWIGTEAIKTRMGDFDFSNGYPARDATTQLREALVFNRAVEAFLAQMSAVSVDSVWEATARTGSAKLNQIVIWEALMDSATLLLTGNCETVYATCAIDLKRDGPVVVEVPAMMLGGFSDAWQRQIMDIGPTGADHGRGGKFLLLPPDYDAAVPERHFSARSSTYAVSFFMRGFQVDGRPDHAVALMKRTRVYPLYRTSDPPATTFVDASQRGIDTVFPDRVEFFDRLATLIEREPRDVIPPHERFALAAIGIEKGKPFRPDARRRALLSEATRFAAAVARANSFASDDPARLVYPDRMWEWAFIGGSATWDSQGYANTDRRAGFAYIAIGMSPAMIEKHVGAGSQYLWTPRDARGAFLDGGTRYLLHIPPNIPAKNFWSVVVYDASSRSMLQTSQPFPSVSTYTNPRSNADGSVDIHFGAEAPVGARTNWIQTVPGKGWFVIFRLYGPLEPFFDKSWKPDDIVALT